MPKKKRSTYSFILPVFFGILLFNVFVGYIMHFSIIAATCMTTQQVAADSRCLYIWNQQIYSIGSKNNPHHGHPCGTDVTSVMPSSHLNSQGSYLLPNYIANVCPAVTNTLTPTATTVPQLTLTPTPTTPTGTGNTLFSVTTLLHGLGSGGDNPNPSSAGNTNPAHPQKPITVTVLNGSNTQIAKIQGNITYNAGGGNFTGQVTMGTIPSGKDLVVLKVAGFLPKQVPGIITVNSGATTTIPSVTLVNGDINNDGQIDLSDYNLLISCFGTKQTTASCLNAQASDINDDGLVNGGDYNLFLRELSVQKGT